MRKWLLVFNICCTAFMLKAQSLEAGLILGGSLYSGDLSPKEFGVYFQEVNPAGGIFGRLNLNDYISMRIGASLAKITGTGDTLQLTTRPSFRSNILELSLTGEIYPFTIGSGDFMLKPYLFGGGAIFRHNPQTPFDGGWIDMQPLGTQGQGLEGYPEPYKLTQFSIPFGGGIKFVINDTWSIGAEFGWRKTFTDYLDDISDATVNYLDIYNGNGALAARISNGLIAGPETGDVNFKRGGPYKDWYYMSGITVSYFLGGSSGYGSSSSRNRVGGRKRGKAMGCPTF
ncbi:MAG TPA: DUF6089 family protein [Saprospiraceae bacterium]|nr:DUF6089 family protein [Saprospiraceae bacterium]HMP23254.1 DUF6089 family protein [Saprospiraceae bacterium]